MVLLCSSSIKAEALLHTSKTNNSTGLTTEGYLQRWETITHSWVNYQFHDQGKGNNIKEEIYKNDFILVMDCD